MFSKRKFIRGPIRVSDVIIIVALFLSVGTVTEGQTIVDNLAPAAVSPLQLHYHLDTPGGGEIFPALASSMRSDYWPVAMLTMVNASSHAVVETVSAEIHDWSRQAVQTITLAPNETRTLRLNPELLPQAFGNAEMRPATLEVRANVLGTAFGYNETRPVYLHAGSDFFWGTNLVNAEYIARWVTPHDPAVLRLVSSARSYVPRGRLAGYELPGKTVTGVAGQVKDEARGVFEALKRLGLTYVDSISTYGSFRTKAERVRLPSETLTLSGANCIDMSVAFASAMENVGLDPVIVLVPGHAFTGVRLARGSSEILYLDLTVMPDGTFDGAMQRAQNWLQKTPKERISIIDIAAARSHEIYPMASFTSTPPAPAIIAQK